MTTFHCSAILFDLDGVLVDSTRSVTRQWRWWAGERGFDPREVAEYAHGVRAVEVIARLAPHLDAQAEVRELERREALDTEGVTVMPGAAMLVKSVPEGRWAVVTSGTRHLADARLRLAGITMPRVVVTSDDVLRGKPDAEPCLKGAQLLGINSAECLVIEDAPAGIQSARAGGMKVIAITSTYPASELKEADAVISVLSQIQVRREDGALRVRV